MDFNKTTQKQLTEIDKQLLLGFKTSSNLHRSLASGFSRKTPVHPALLFSNGKTKEYLEQARQELALKAKETTSKEKFLLESDVKSLSSNPKMESNPRTESMISRQKESRRKRHIDFLNEFENVIETLYKTTDSNCRGIKQEIEIFFQQSDTAINRYLDSLTDGELLTREIDFIDDLSETIKKHQEKRSEKLYSLFTLLQGQETERQNTIAVCCEKLEEDLMETAFILEPEVRTLIHDKTSALEKDTQEFCSKNKEHLEIFNRIQNETFEKFEQMSQMKEQRWRTLKHEEALRNFRTDIQDLSFVNPPGRIKLYQELKAQQLSFFKQREQYMRKLQELDFSTLTRRGMERWLEEYQAFVEKTDQAYDKTFDSLLKEHEGTQEKARGRLNKLVMRLESVNAQISLPLKDLIEQECEPFLSKLNENGKNLLTDAIKFVEESDSKSNDVIKNLAGLLMKVAGKFDDHKKDIGSHTQAYELEKAKLADTNDDKLEVLNQEFESLKTQLQRAIHHPMLEEKLASVFEKIDDLEKEYRDFHGKNIDLARGHPKIIENAFVAFEKAYAGFFELVDHGKKEELQQRNLKRAQEKVQKMLEEEEIARVKEEERLIEEAKKKGGKAPPPKPKQKDPKKAAQELEIRQKELLEKVGIEPLEFFDTQMGNKFILVLNLKELSEKMYAPSVEEDKKVEPKKEKAENEPKKEVDMKPESPLDSQNTPILDKNVVFSCEMIKSLLQVVRGKVFEFLHQWKTNCLNENAVLDKEFIEGSILILDDRLKVHYPLKGKMEVDFFATRSAQITEHKKKYERHTRNVLDKLNLQSEEFNYLLEQCIADTKSYEEDQRRFKDSLPSALSLPKLQGILNTVRETYYKFNEKIRSYKEQLELLSVDEMKKLLQQSVTFLQESKFFEDGGTYSVEEVKWYEEMLKEIDGQVTQNQAQRQAKTKDIIEYMEKKKQELLDGFEKQYAVALEELACREGTGKKYGRPRRLFQERLRTEMTKCEKAQEGINSNIEKLKRLYQEFSAIKSKTEFNNLLECPTSISLRVRRILMKVRTCIGKYSAHIQALKPDSKSQEMPRITYNEFRFDILLDAQAETEKDKSWKEEELEELGPLYFQKETRNFMEWLQDIEKNVKEEAQKIYTGANAKFLTGADKIPDYLRNYLTNMKKQGEDFRISCVRYLRNSCEELSQLSKEISQMVIESTLFKYRTSSSNEKNKLEKTFADIFEENEKQKSLLTFQLRPNLSNPSCKEELDRVCAAETSRVEKIMAALEEFREKLLANSFAKAQDFFKVLVNNSEFLLLYFDCVLLFEDFIRLPGDEEIVKKHESLKTLLKRKQKGALIDTSSERSIMKVWPGIFVGLFQIGDKKIDYVAPIPADQKTEKNPKKEAKKDLKDIQPEADKPEATREIKTFKTYRQKTVIKDRSTSVNEYKKKFDEEVEEIKKRFERIKYEEQKYQFHWDQKVHKLRNPDA